MGTVMDLHEYSACTVLCVYVTVEYETSKFPKNELLIRTNLTVLFMPFHT